MHKLTLVAVAFLTLPILATPIAALAAGPTSLGVFSDWTSAQIGEGSAHVCYAFTRAIGSAKTPSAAMIIVSERSTSRDEVVVNATSNYTPGTEVAVQIDRQPPVSFYTAGRSAFARDGRATVIGLQKGSDATATTRAASMATRNSRSPGSARPMAPSSRHAPPSECHNPNAAG
jgi:hypothetical protein